VKSADSFARKAREYESPFKQIEDQIGGRVIVYFEHDVSDALALLRRTFNEVEQEHKRPDSIGEFGYEGEHLNCTIPQDARTTAWQTDASLPEVFELQVKTVFQHAWAAAHHDLGYKPTVRLSSDQLRALAWIAASAWGADRQFEQLWREVERTSDFGSDAE
jgi:ppGpp synthetase/RelA/SpoT-type nucleotidyltranferase